MIYNTILRELAITVNALKGAQPVALQTTYETVPLTETNFQSSAFPFLFLIDKMLNAQEALFMAIASIAEQPLRGFIESQTAALAYGDEILTDSASTPVVGAYGAVYDAVNNEPCTLNELEDIRSRHENPNGMFKLSVYEYAILDKRIYHTRANVIVDVCAYERPDADTLNLTTNILLPDILGPAMVQGAITECYRDDEYLEQAARAGQIFTAWVTALQSGLTNIQPQSNPTPDAQRAYAA